MQIDHTQNIIEIDDVCFAYNHEQVLHNITFNIHKGDYLGVIGPNGSGKTTLLKIILGLLQPQCGTIKLFGQPIKEFKSWYKIGYVPQNRMSVEVKFPATVREVVTMGRIAKRGLFHSFNAEDQKYVQEALKEVGMDSFGNRLISDLSGGQQQRVFIARALAAQPEVLFLDEPTTGVDVHAQEEFYALLKKLNQMRELTLILVSHDLSIIDAEVTEIACINKKVMYYGNPHQIDSKDLIDNFYGKGMRHLIHNH